MQGAAVTAQIASVGCFDTALWAGIAPRGPVAALHAQVDATLRLAGIAPDRRAYVPHVTLARFARRRATDPAVDRWLGDHATLASPLFTVDRLILFESTLGGQGARYEPVAFWPLG